MTHFWQDQVDKVPVFFLQKYKNWKMHAIITLPGASASWKNDVETGNSSIGRVKRKSYDMGDYVAIKLPP